MIGIYVMVLGGVFYYNLFKWTFDEKLKDDVIELARVKSSDMIQGIMRSPTVVTIPEYDVMTWLKGDKRIMDILYLNGNGTIRWHKQSKYIGMNYDEYEKQIGGFPTPAIGVAYATASPKVFLVPKQPFYEVAIPLKARSDKGDKGEVVIGILEMIVSREGAERVIQSAMAKYIIGAIGVLVLLAIPLYLFLNHYVISPLMSLRDSIDTISTKSFEIKFAARRDEIGDLAMSVSQFLEKVRAELVAVTEREAMRQGAEQSWWQSVLSVAVPRGSRALVVDEDNSVLFANFDIPASPGQKLHLLDVVDNQQQDVLRLVGLAMDSPRQIIEGDTVFRGEASHVKVVQIQSDASAKRTLIMFEPRRA
jgi:HAMP domain-containing protein